MTYIVPVENQPIDIRLDDHDQPKGFRWMGKEHVVKSIANFYRVPDGSLEAPICRDYFEITTGEGWLMLLYHDLIAGEWGLESLYD